jgi:hypothetical protein
MTFFYSKNVMFILLSLFISKNIFCQEIKFNQYIKYSKQFQSFEDLIDKEKYSKCLKKLEKLNINDLPIGLKRNYFLDKAHCLFYTNQYEQARKYYISFFSCSMPSKFIQNFKSEFEAVHFKEKTFYEILTRDFDSIRLTKNNLVNLNLKNEILEICNNDQTIRLESVNEVDENKRNDILVKMKSIDSINQKTFDSISLLYGWINRDMLLGESRNPFIILFHADKQKRYEYIKRGIKLAIQNKIDWEEVIELQSYSIFREALLNENQINFIETFNINDYQSNRDNFDFVCYSLAKQLSDGGLFYDNQKAIKLYINTSQYEWRKKKCYHYIKKYLLKNNVYKKQICYRKLNNLIFKNEENLIGIEFVKPK